VFAGVVGRARLRPIIYWFASPGAVFKGPKVQGQRSGGQELAAIEMNWK